MKKLVVEQSSCIGCGACNAVDQEHFDFDDAGLIEVKTQENINSELIMDAINSCPTDAIKLIEK